jgi:hypothetical protein
MRAGTGTAVSTAAPLERTGTGPSGTATVQVVNDSPYALEVLYSGPVADQLPRRPRFRLIVPGRIRRAPECHPP